MLNLTEILDCFMHFWKTIPPIANIRCILLHIYRKIKPQKEHILLNFPSYGNRYILKNTCSISKTGPPN